MILLCSFSVLLSQLYLMLSLGTALHSALLYVRLCIGYCCGLDHFTVKRCLAATLPQVPTR